MGTTLNCIVIDDEPLARELIRSYVEKTPALRMCGSFESAADAMKTVISGEIDIVFLDINMPMLNGIDFAALIPERTRIIYVTAYEQYALQGFKVNALDYLLKPVSYPEFMSAVGKAVKWCSMRDSYETQSRGVQNTITVKSEYRLIQMKIETITYIEVQKDRVIFYRTDGDPVSSLMSMRDLEEHLPADLFMRVHRSFIVNMSNIEVVERGRIIFGKTYVPVADSKRDEFFARLGK